MKKFLDNWFILIYFLVWRLGLFLVGFIATLVLVDFVPSFPYFNSELVSAGLPNWIWGFGNFDGVHYLRIAKSGYESALTQAFFPIYPILINFFALGKYYFLSGLFVSNSFALLTFFVFYRLVQIDFDRKMAYKSLILFIFFPTSFYLVTIYSESLFLFLTLLCFWAIRKKYFILSGILALLASSTRIFGVFLTLAILIEVLLMLKNQEIKLRTTIFYEAILGLVIAPLGLAIYMYYLKISFNDPVYFLTAQASFGAERSSQIILFPQVIYRYLKILFTVPITSYQYFTALLEIIFTLVPLIILALNLKKIRLSYTVFMLGCLILPSLTGSLSSMPRYVLNTLFLLPIIVINWPKYWKAILVIFGIIQLILLSLFLRGYWIA